MEKERYYSLIDNNGNFELRDYESGQVIHSLFELDDLLNQQDARIKKLEKIRDKGNQKLENFYNKKIDELDNAYNKSLDELIKANQQLELSQNQKAIEELEKVIDFVRYVDKKPEHWDICQFIDNQIKELSIK